MSNDRAEQLAVAKKKRTMSTDSLLLLQQQEDEKKSKVDSPGLAGSSASTSHRSLAQLSLRAQDDNMEEGGGLSAKNLSGGTEGNLSTRAVSEDGLLLEAAAAGGGNNNRSQSSSEDESFDDRFSSGENSRTGTPSGNWGWFEDVHASTQTDGGPFLFANTTAANKSDTDTTGSSGNNSNIKGKDRGMKLSNNTNNYNKGGGGGGTKSKGLFDELMQNMLSIVPPQHHQQQRQGE